MFSLVLGCGLDPQFGKDTGLDGEPPTLTGTRISAMEMRTLTEMATAMRTGESPGPMATVMVGLVPMAMPTRTPMPTPDADADADADGSSPGSPSSLCPDGESYYDCDLTCVSSSSLAFIGDGWCDDGSAGINFNCEEFSFDAGDCAGGSGADADGTGGGCDALEAEDCDGTCHLSALIGLYLGDGDCNEGGIIEPNLNCADYAYDNGDCTGGSGDGGSAGACPDGESEDCLVRSASPTG